MTAKQDCRADVPDRVPRTVATSLAAMRAADDRTTNRPVPGPRSFNRPASAAAALARTGSVRPRVRVGPWPPGA